MEPSPPSKGKGQKIKEEGQADGGPFPPGGFTGSRQTDSRSDEAGQDDEEEEGKKRPPDFYVQHSGISFLVLLQRVWVIFKVF
jgi:hypothetical protein